jgi:ATP-binding cassette subfamily B (MDR/TAP) protein 1
VIFYCGAIFINEYGLTISDLFTAMFAIMSAAFATGNANQYLPDYGKMISSAKSIFEIIDMKTESKFI